MTLNKDEARNVKRKFTITDSLAGKQTLLSSTQYLTSAKVHLFVMTGVMSGFSKMKRKC